MSTYKQIAGTTVKAYTTNPSDPQEGEMWYNQTTLKLRGVTALGAWSSGGFLATPAFLSAAFGSQTAAVTVGGTAPGPVFRNDTQEYNGTGWSSGTDYPTNISNSGRGGTSTAGLVLGGNTPPYTTAANEYDGSTWTSTGALPTAGDNFGSCATETQTNGIFAQGRNSSSGNSGNDKTFTYDGSTFSAGPDINTARMFSQSSGGTGTAGIIYGGFIDPSPNAMTNTEEYDGSSWTTGGALNRASGLNCGFGVQTNAVAQVNTPGYKGTENYDGTAWTNLPDMALDNNSSNYSTAAGATGNAGFITSRGPGFNQTEEWNFSAQVVTPGAWASGGALPSGRQSPGGFGSQTAAVACGGEEPGTPGINTTDNYDGSSWTNSGNYPFAASEIGTLGTQTAGIGMGGYQVPSPRTRSSASNEYDGSTWTAGGTYPISASNIRGCGTQTAALGVGGDTYPPAPTRNSDVTAEYNGTTWTAGGSLGTAGYAGHAGGTQTEAVFSGGTGRNSLTEEYNGSSWSTGGAPLYPIGFGGHTNGSPASNFANFGTNASANQNQLYDGTSYATQPSLGTNRQSTGGAGNSGTAGIVFGGRVPPSFRTETEEFTPETTSANSVDITTAE